MILIATKNQVLQSELVAELTQLRVATLCVDTAAQGSLAAFYQTEVTAAIIDATIPALPTGASTDFLNGLGHRIPVVVIQEESDTDEVSNRLHGRDLSDAVTIASQPSAAEVLATLAVSGALGELNTNLWRKTVAYYNQHISKRMLVENKCLGILTIDASSFRKIEVEHGSEIYAAVKTVFQSLLTELWGKPGSFRSSDVLCRRSDHGNTYYVFLNRSRTTGTLPLPGVMEDIADRLARMIHNALLGELVSPASTRRLPECIDSMPKVIVGHGGALYNPCLDPYEIVSTAIENSNSFAQIQLVRNRDRYRELMITLIQTPGLLVPHYQAVFNLANIKRSEIEEAQKQKNFKPLVDHLYGFESLIRVRVDEVRALLGSARSIIDPRYLRPDVLFETAKLTKVGLELDQACLNLAIAHGQDLPGYLMVNILPRNLYFIKHLAPLLTQRQKLVLEVSESETINNFEQIHAMQRQFGDDNLLIAADDFGKAFAGLDRIIQMRPHLIKFDRSLIQDIHKDPVKHAYVLGLVNAARMLKTEVLAEGVELIEEFEVLQKLGINYIQGFLLHRPESVEVIHQQLETIELKSSGQKSVA